MIARSELAEERFLLIRQRVVESAPFQEFFRGTDRHHFHDVQVASPFDAVPDQRTTDARALILSMHRQALKFGQLGTVDFNCREPDQLCLLVALHSHGNETVSGQFDDLGLGSGQQQPAHDVGPHQCVNGLRITRKRLPNDDPIWKRPLRSRG